MKKTPPPREVDIRHLVPCAIGLFLVVSFVYALTLFPTVPPGDSGELIVQSYLLGVIHPPGYPLYTMLAKLFSLLPWGSIAWRVNFLSAVCNAGAAVFIFLSLTKLTRTLWAGLLVAGLFAFSSIVWRYSVVAEVFGLNNLIVASLVFLSVLYAREKNLRVASITAFVMGLGLSNHHTIVFYEFPLGVWLLLYGGKPLRRRFHVLVLCGLLGLTPYAYLWFAGLRHVPGAWGDTATLSGFLTHVLRREYGTFQLAAGSGHATELMDYLAAYFKAAFMDSLWVGPLLASFGSYWFFQKQKPVQSLVATWTIAFFLYVLAFHSMANITPSPGVPLAILSRFWQQANLLLFIGFGMGLFALHTPLKQKSTMLGAGFVALFSVALVVQVALNYGSSDEHKNYTFAKLGHALLTPLPQSSFLILVGNEMLGSAWYLQKCEEVRPDVQIADLFLLETDWLKKTIVANETSDVSVIKFPADHYLPGDPNGYNLRQLFDANLGHHPIFISYFTPDSVEASDNSAEQDFTMWPFGLVNEVFSAKQPFDPNTYLEKSARFYSALPIADVAPFQDRPWENHLLRLLRETRFQRSYALIQRGSVASPISTDLLRIGVSDLEKLIASDPSPDAHWYETLKIARQRLSQIQPTL